MATPQAPKPPSEPLPRWWGPDVDDGYPPEADARGLAALLAPMLGISFPAAREQLATQTARPRFLLVECLGRSQAEVYRAIDRLLERVVVVKIYATAEALDEARLIARARHLNVVEVHEVGVHDQQLFLVLEWCEGTTLFEWSKGRPWQQVLDKVLEAGAGLQRCHELGIVHGDIKPNNILVTQGRAVIADFGLAGSPGFDPLNAGGTMHYMAPELFEGRRRPSNDVYALACTAWVCLFGEPPFPGKTALEVLMRAERAPDEPRDVPLSMRDEVLQALVLGMNPNAKRRPSMRAWLASVADAADDRRWRRRVLRSVANAVALVAAVVVISRTGHEAICVAEPVPAEVVEVAAEPEPLVIDEQETGIPRAIELVEAGEPLKAWEVFATSQDTGTYTMEQVLRLASAFILYAENQELHETSPGNREIAARFAWELAQLAGATYHSSTRRSHVPQAIEISERAEAILTR